VLFNFNFIFEKFNHSVPFEKVNYITTEKINIYSTNH
jgi:hypothetical protein